MSVNLEYYKTFYYVAKYKNFTKTANVLFTSQPTISQQMKNLENDLGCRLFVRNKNGAELTPEGTRLYAYVSVGMEQFMKGEADLSSSISLENGTIYLGATETALHGFLLEVLNEFHTKYPKVKLKIMNTSTTIAISQLQSGSINFAVVTTPTDIQAPLKQTNLKTFSDVLIAGKQYNELKEKKLELKDVAQYPLICLGSGTKTYSYMEEFYKKHGLILSPDIEPETSDMILPMVKNNLGVGFIPQDLANAAIKQGEVFKIELNEEIPLRHICLVQDPQRPQSIAANELKKMILSRKEEKIN